MPEERKGISLKFTIPLPDKYAPIAISLWTERDKRPDEYIGDMMVNIAGELIKEMKTISESVVAEVLAEEKRIYEDLNDD